MFCDELVGLKKQQSPTSTNTIMGVLHSEAEENKEWIDECLKIEKMEKLGEVEFSGIGAQFTET